MPACPNFATEVETGPPPVITGEDDPVVQEQLRLEGDIEKINTYASQHPDDFAFVRFENSPWVRIVVGFTGHIAEHCAALRDLLEDPDEFEIILEPVTQTRLEEIQAELSVMAGESLIGSGIGAGNVFVDLRADSEAAAAAIHEKYGDLVDITLGMFGYPDMSSGGEGGCADMVPPPTTEPVSLSVTLALTDETVKSGADFTGSVTVTNTRPDVLHFESGSPLAALVYRPGEADPVGAFTGAIAGVGVGADLQPGESIDIDVLGGTASCDSSLGYALPAGDYEVRVPVDQYEYPNGAFELHAIYSDRAALTIVP
jgi:hypothetical protein